MLHEQSHGMIADSLDRDRKKDWIAAAKEALVSGRAAFRCPQ
jgi:hypothetical protein